MHLRLSLPRWGLRDLLEKIMEIVVVYAGAHRGALVLSQEGNLSVVATYQARSGAIVTLDALPMTNTSPVPARLIRSVYKRGEPVTLTDATRVDELRDSDYMDLFHPRSMLCVPISHQATPIGVLYLENNVTTHAFSWDRLKVLQTMVTQMAISIEHALIYERLTEARLSAEAANEAKSTFLAKMSHELRTPLNAIIGYSELLYECRDEADTPEFEEDLLRIKESGEHLLKLIQDILDVSPNRGGAHHLGARAVRHRDPGAAGAADGPPSGQGPQHPTRDADEE